MKIYRYQDFSSDGAITGALQQMIPIYGLVNGAKKNRALEKYGKSGISGGEHALRQMGANLLGGIPGLIHGGNTGSKFEDLVDELTDKYMKKHRDAKRSEVRRAIKNALYHNRESKYLED